MSSIPTLRTRIAGAFNDDELRDLCFDHFPAVGSEFTAGMTKGQMIHLLLGYCVRRQLGSMLLDVLEQERPGLIGPDSDALLAQLDAARLDEAPSALPAALLDRLPLDTIPDPAPLPPGSRQLPIDPNPLFVGRADELQRLAATLKAGGTAVITTGIGGIGKTQLAAEFAHRYGQFFAGGVFWLSFADPAGIPGEIAACGGAGALALYTDASDLTQEERVEKVLAEWRKGIPRLLIFDNCDDHPSGVSGEELLGYWKRGLSACRIPVTSRRQEWAPTLGLTTHNLGCVLESIKGPACRWGIVTH